MEKVITKQDDLSTSEVLASELKANGFCVIKNFFDFNLEILPILKAIEGIIDIILVSDLKETPEQFKDFREKYKYIIKADRTLGGVIYDAVKQIPDFVQLISNSKCIEIAKQLRQTDLIGICRGGDGIRIDNPGEAFFQAPWHQEYPVQFGSPNGLVFWSPLVPIDQEVGPVDLLVGSHQEGFLKVYYEESARRGTAYGVRILEEERLIQQYPRQQLIVQPGDCAVMDFFTVHRSGANISDLARWSMQFRYFDFRHPEGQRIHWANGVSQNNSIENVYPHFLTGGPYASAL